MDNIRKTYSEEFKRHIVEEIEGGGLCQIDAAREYGLAKSLVKLWLSEYGRFRPQRSVMEIVMKSEKDKIAELEKALAEAHLKIRLYDEILTQAGKKYKTDLKKTFGIERPECSSDKVGKSSRSAKR